MTTNKRILHKGTDRELLIIEKNGNIKTYTKKDLAGKKNRKENLEFAAIVFLLIFYGAVISYLIFTI